MVANHSQQTSWSRRKEEEESERIAGDEKESEGRCGEAEDRRGRKDHADAARPLGSQPCAGLGGSGARGAAGGARVRPGARQMLESPPKAFPLPRPPPETAGHSRGRATRAVPGSPRVQAAPPHRPRGPATSLRL